MALPLSGYFDCCATTPLAEEVRLAMQTAEREAWANPSSLHGFGLAAAESLERDRQRLAALLGADPDSLLFTSGGTESIHLALRGSAAVLERHMGRPGRVLISAVEHPASVAAAEQLRQRGWDVVQIPVDRCGVLDLEALEALLKPPTSLVSVIWGQSEVGTLQPLSAIGERCRDAGVLLHVDAVQVVGHLPVRFRDLPVDLLSLAAHKCQGPRGIGALLVRPGIELDPLLSGGGQEGGLRAGTESVVLVHGFATAVELSERCLQSHAGCDPVAALRNRLASLLLEDGQLGATIEITGPDPWQEQRLPQHLSVVVRDDQQQPLSGRRLVQAMARLGFAVSSGSACSSGSQRPSAVLLALGFNPADAAGGLRISLGPWHTDAMLAALVHGLRQARQELLRHDL